jgi:exosortase A-associated hydrolase 2
VFLRPGKSHVPCAVHVRLDRSTSRLAATRVVGRMEEAFFFDVEGQRLLAIAHHPGARPPAAAVVICHPYAEEKQLSYPVLAGFARELAAAGLAVLRFDCRGYGDSDGDLGEATLATQVADTLAAVALARARFGVRPVVLLGLRLGAMVAALAAERVEGAQGLVLWSPVVDGAAYVDDLLRKRLFAEMLAKRKATRAEILADLDVRGRVEIEGNEFTRALRDELTAVDLATRRPVCAAFAATLGPAQGTPPGLVALQEGYEAAGLACAVESVDARPFWERSAMYDLYVPEALFGRTRAWLAGRGVTA